MIQQDKKCSRCKQVKLLNEFRNQTKGKYGKKNYCKICDDKNAKELYNRNKDIRKLQVIIWNEKHPEQIKKYQEKFNINFTKCKIIKTVQE